MSDLFTIIPLQSSLLKSSSLKAIWDSGEDANKKTNADHVRTCVHTYIVFCIIMCFLTIIVQICICDYLCKNLLFHIRDTTGNLFTLKYNYG